jgi:hypothetical protein
MTRPVPGRRRWLGIVLAALAVGPGLPAPADAQEVAARQVTLFAIIATPGSTMIDPKLAAIQPQLRKLLPGHGFKLLDVQSKRLLAGESVQCDLGHGLNASTVLIQPLDPNGKIELRCTLMLNAVVQFDTRVATPSNQLFFCDRLLDDGTRLLIGVGAR